MSIYLVQHARSLSKDIDPEKGISDEGRADAERIAGVAKGYQVQVKKIKHSGKKRAQQTAEIFANTLNPNATIEKTMGLNPLDDVTLVAPSLKPKEDIMLVGHLPNLERLTSYLVSGKTDHSVFKFQNGGIVCLDKEPQEEYWHIKWSLMPKIG